MPLRIEQAQTERHRLQRQVLELGQGFALHALLNGLAVLIHPVQLRGHFTRSTHIVGEQAFDAQAHVVQAPRRVQAWAEDEPKVSGGDA
ncbi:hypothetical protein D3C78_1051590 [compost metagenome]